MLRKGRRMNQHVKELWARFCSQYDDQYDAHEIRSVYRQLVGEPHPELDAKMIGEQILKKAGEEKFVELLEDYLNE